MIRTKVHQSAEGSFSENSQCHSAEKPKKGHFGLATTFIAFSFYQKTKNQTFSVLSRTIKEPKLKAFCEIKIFPKMLCQKHKGESLGLKKVCPMQKYRRNQRDHFGKLIFFRK